MADTVKLTESRSYCNAQICITHMRKEALMPSCLSPTGEHEKVGVSPALR